MLTFDTDLENAISLRNKNWSDNKEIPSWIKINDVGLDQFFTKASLAEELYNDLLRFLSLRGVDLLDCVFIEPSAGSGSFFDLLPKGLSIGLDIMPLKDDILQQDFLSWKPSDDIKDKTIIFVGNPPFGYRGWLALSFMNHAAKYADYVGFILPMSFQSEGKGSPKNRVKDLRLEHSKILPKDSFVSPSGKIEKVNALWQIWEKGINVNEIEVTCDDWLDIFTVDLRKERLCGVGKMQHADFFLQRTYYNEAPTLVKNFSQVKYVCGYGLIFKKNKEEMTRALQNIDWNNYSNLAAHNCRHISMYHIKRALTDNKFVDGNL